MVFTVLFFEFLLFVVVFNFGWVCVLCMLDIMGLGIVSRSTKTYNKEKKKEKKMHLCMIH